MVIDLRDILAYVLAFLRASGILLFVPIFSSRSVPWSLKMLLSALTALLVGSFVPRPEGFWGLGETVLLGLREFGIGVLLGLLVRIFFGAVQTAGQLMGYQMGFGMGEILDPQGEYSIPVLSHFMTLFAILIFLHFNVHHWYIASIASSFRLIPPGTATFDKALRALLSAGTMLFGLAFRLAAPLLVLNLLFYTALTILGRAVPQMNVFLVSLPLQVGLGLLGMGLVLPYVASFLGRFSGELRGEFFDILRLMGG